MKHFAVFALVKRVIFLKLCPPFPHLTRLGAVRVYCSRPAIGSCNVRLITIG